MAGLPRGDLPEGTYHVTTRTAGPIPMFLDDLDRSQFVNLLLRTLMRRRWTCRAFCLMTTHYHLLVEVPEDDLDRGMKSLNWQYAWWFNRRHARAGHLVGRRYGAVLIETDAHMLNAMRYIALNPVHAGLCRKPEGWAWSSYRRCVGLEDPFAFVDPSPLQAYFGGDLTEAARRIRLFVGTGDSR